MTKEKTQKTITEKDLIKDFPSVEKQAKEWESLYPEFLPMKSSQEDIFTPIFEPIFIYQIHTST